MSDIFISKEKSSHFETHWLALSMFIVILASDQGSGRVDRQCSSSDVSSGDIVGSSFEMGW